MMKYNETRRCIDSLILALEHLPVLMEYEPSKRQSVAKNVRIDYSLGQCDAETQTR